MDGAALEASGDRQARPVTALIPGDGVKRLYTITVDTDGSSGDETAQIVATDNHRFWLPDAGTWVKAKQLQPGMWLQTGSGTWVQVSKPESVDQLGPVMSESACRCSESALWAGMIWFA